MKKVTGFVDDFRRANIMEKMPKTYFFDEEDRPDKMAKYIRRRQQPIATEQVQIKKQKDEVAVDIFNMNYLIDDAMSFPHQQKRVQIYEQNKRRGHDRIAKFSEFSGEILKVKDTTKEFTFGQRKYAPPPAIEKVSKVDEEKDKQKPIIRKALVEKKEQYDFFQLNKEFQQRMRQQKNPSSKDNEKQVDESIEYPETIQDIERLNERKLRAKIFTYQLDFIPIGQEIKPIYQMKIQEKAIVLGKGKYKTFQINFLRDLGHINRYPPNHTFYLSSYELDVKPNDLKYHDILNVASGRLDKQNLMNCVRKQGVSKQEFLNAQKVYDKLKKEEKILRDVDVEAGEQMIQDDFNEEKSEDKIDMSETARYVAEITELKFEIGKMKKIVLDSEEFNAQVQQRLRFLLNEIFEKVVAGTNVENPTLQYLKKNVTEITGQTDSGFDRKRLLWLYSDCVALFQSNIKGESIKNLAAKASQTKGTFVTGYKEQPTGKAAPKTRRAMNKPPVELNYKVQPSRSVM